MSWLCLLQRLKKKCIYFIMAPMRLHTAKFLLLLVTISGIIMPIHDYAHASAESQESYPHERHFQESDLMEITELGGQHDPSCNSATCDHCHFSSHAVGLMRDSSRTIVPQKMHIVILLSQHYSSYHQAPPYHPPIA